MKMELNYKVAMGLVIFQECRPLVITPLLDKALL